MLHKFNLIAAAIAGGLIVLFALQNLADVQVTFLFWNFQTKRYLVIMTAAAVGLLAGLALGYSLGHHRRSLAEAPHHEGSDSSL